MRAPASTKSHYTTAFSHQSNPFVKLGVGDSPCFHTSFTLMNAPNGVRACQRRGRKTALAQEPR